MRTWAYRLLFDLSVASKQELDEANVVVGTAALWAKGVCLVALIVSAWLHPGYTWQWGQWVIAVALIDLLYRRRVDRVSVAEAVKLNLLRRNAVGFGIFWGGLVADGAGLVTHQWGMTLGFGGVLVGLAGLVSYARHREAKPKAFTPSNVAYRRWRQCLYRWVLGLAVLDEVAVQQVDDRFGLALVGLQLFAYWSMVGPAILQDHAIDWWIGLLTGFVIVAAVTQSVSSSGLDQEIYHDAGAFYKRRRHLFIWQLMEMVLFAGVLGSVAWWHSHDRLLTGMSIVIGIGIARSTYTDRRGKIFLGAKR